MRAEECSKNFIRGRGISDFAFQRDDLSRITLILKLIAWSACTRSEWAASLDHKVFYDPVKNEAVVKGLVLLFTIGSGPGLGAVSETGEILDGNRGLVFKKLYYDRALVRFHTSD